ncbi:uncharacterized protein LOC110652203 isoform X2 [Hevea brasiliensis]|uniref:uncharacterized protein LOC110652203 isoform X2 n=1 Tax=Hevea brasiliensis TaxID=3981 RepID=UPI0025F14357|nr:uncharacterized protein LOC110652203 isoform X2 [Hevea brasiliensis]
MEKLIYIHVLRLGESLYESDDVDSGYRDATNDWYLLKQTDGNNGVEIQFSRVFEDINQVNHPGPALVGADCAVIGSFIYVIGGRSNVTEMYSVRCGGDGCKEIRCLDTRNARDGWKTCFALPFTFSGGRSAVVDGRWLYLFAGNRHDGFRNPDPWGFALNVVDSNKGEVEVRKIIKPHLSRFYPIASASLSPDDGILYTYDTIHMRLDSYDVANRKELPSVDLPRSFWFGREEDVELIVLAKDRFCVIWHDDGYDVNEICIYYTRFSVSYDLPKPTATVEDSRAFPIRGVEILNIVTLDPHSDAMANDLSCNSGVDN